LCLGLLANTPGSAATYRIIYKFGATPDANSPASSLVADDLGRLYGSASSGGASNGGAIYRLTRPASGEGPWSEEILHNFDYFVEGGGPASTVLLDASGNVYGGTGGGGPLQHGSLYKLSNLPGWPITVLHFFGPPPDGANVGGSGPVFGPDGLIYGVTLLGGLKGQGTAYSVSPLGDTTEYAILHIFGKGNDGTGPFGLAESSTGGFFGVTDFGGSVNDTGVAFSLRRNAAGTWHESVNLQFGDTPGVVSPQAPDVLGKKSLKPDLYGCGGGGKHNGGVAYKLSPPTASGGAWTETVLYNFGATPTDAQVIGRCGLTQDPSGKLYGTSVGGGTYGYGTFFELDPPSQAGGAWTETILHNFNLKRSGGNPQYGAPLRVGGLFYGNVETEDGFGAIYELSPNDEPPAAMPRQTPIAQPVPAAGIAP
jgi:hypothetical protein